MDRPIRGMENVVATVSGYHGLERFNLIKLISQAGASYVGAMSKSITHLVCWEFEGKKYDLAKKFKTIIVNHRWVEDCIKQGKRVPEYPYTLQSGKDAGPLLLEAPVIYEVEAFNKSRNALSDKSNISEYIEEQINSVGWGDSGLAAQTDSFWLDENFFSEMRKENSSAYRSKSKQGAKTSKHESRSRGRYCSQDPPVSVVELEHDNSSPKSSMHLGRHKGKISGDVEPSTASVKRLVKGKRKISNDIGSTSLAESSCRSTRLVKENFSRDNKDIELLDSDQDFPSTELHNKISKAAASSEHKDCEQKVNIYGSGRTSTAATNFEVSAHQTFDDIVEIRDMNSLKSPSGAAENLGDKNKDSSQPEPVTRLPASEELSCVICWTEFSSTRGVLPCGHRFCYSCIQNWADQMIASGKTSKCPLCKVDFVSITKVEDAAKSDQKIYSQTIPCANSATEILLVNDQERRLAGAESSAVCGGCECREPEDLLIMCDHCNVQCIHIYCLDPPLIPWTCVHCKDLQRLLYQAR